MRQIAKPELDQILKDHRLWLESRRFKGIQANLWRGHMRASDLRGADLRWAIMQETNLKYANLQDANLRGAYLRGADLRGADLEGANLEETDLRGAQFNTNIQHCLCFARARFTHAALPWLILHPKWSALKDSVRIEEAMA